MKKWYVSKTLWVNLLAVLAAGLATQGIDLTPEMQGTTVAFVMGVVNIVLRMTTSTGLEA